MPHNIEIKARARDYIGQWKLAQLLTQSKGEIILQEDIFYEAQRGRLKLRSFNEASGEVIAYERAEGNEPRSSRYCISKTTEPHALRDVLDRALPRLGTIRKKRTLFLAGQTRIHFDEVESLGKFIELEVVMIDGQSEEEGKAIARTIMKELAIEESDLLEEAYIDMMQMNSPSKG